MLVLEAQISDVHRDRNFGRIEARVNLLVKDLAGQPPRWLSMRTSVPRHGAKPLRFRLVEDAARLAGYYPSLNAGRPAQAA